MRFLERWARPALFVSIMTSVVLFNLYAALSEASFREPLQASLLAQTVGARPPYEWVTNALDRRLSTLEDLNLDRRVGVVESTLVDVKDGLADLKRWNQGIAVTVIGHMLITGFGLSKKAAK